MLPTSKGNAIALPPVKDSSVLAQVGSGGFYTRSSSLFHQTLSWIVDVHSVERIAGCFEHGRWQSVLLLQHYRVAGQTLVCPIVAWDPSRLDLALTCATVKTTQVACPNPPNSF